MIVNLNSDSFPALENPVRANWAPIFLTPIRGSEERLIIGVAVFNDAGFHIEAANALGRLQCLYGSQSDIVIQVAGIALDELQAELSARAGMAIADFKPSITGVTAGEIRQADGVSLQAIGASWMSALSSLYDAEAAGLMSEGELLDDASYQDKFEAFAGGDRLPRLVLDYVVEERSGLAGFFRSDLANQQQRRRRSHEVSIDFSGSKLVANFGTLGVGQISRSVDLIKRRLWDLKVDRDSETVDTFSRQHEMLIQMPASDDPQVSEKQFENLEVARKALEAQADQEELRLEAYTTVAAIGRRVLTAEAPRDGNLLH